MRLTWSTYISTPKDRRGVWIFYRTLKDKYMKSNCIVNTWKTYMVGQLVFTKRVYIGHNLMRYYIENITLLMNLRTLMKKLKIKNKEYGQRHIINNIKRVYKETTEDSHFYDEAFDWCADIAKRSNISVFMVAGVLAALSPLREWENNKTLAYDAIIHGNIHGHFSNQVNKVKEILKGATIRDIETILKGIKTVNFFRNIISSADSTSVTIDRHAIGIALNTYSISTISQKQYEFLADCYRKASAELNIIPKTLQATTWVFWREQKGYSYGQVR